MAILWEKGGFLFQIFPQFFPENRMTETEINLWILYSDFKQSSKNKNG